MRKVLRQKEELLLTSICSWNPGSGFPTKFGGKWRERDDDDAGHSIWPEENSSEFRVSWLSYQAKGPCQSFFFVKYRVHMNSSLLLLIGPNFVQSLSLVSTAT